MYLPEVEFLAKSEATKPTSSYATVNGRRRPLRATEVGARGPRFHHAAYHLFLTAAPHFCRFWPLKTAVPVGLGLLRFVWPAPPETRLTFRRHYAYGAAIKVRIFMQPPATQSRGPGGAGEWHENLKGEGGLGRSHGPGSKELLPLYLDAHGGSFAAGDAEVGDALCAAWARRTSTLVAAFSYRKALAYRFPTALRDVAALAAPSSLLLACARGVLVRAVVAYYSRWTFSSPPYRKYADRP
ncbi:hypothetical protein DL765_005304 [Monosporascus sp. GIB2]|nr:hypothetical protein DL765_005304 [Monosporascus sp. GIB2]